VTLAAMLGHSKINMVLRYAHPTQDHQTNAMDKMEKYVSEQKIAHAKRTPRPTRHKVIRLGAAAIRARFGPATFPATAANVKGSLSS
jgi:hypothetical protein